VKPKRRSKATKRPGQVSPAARNKKPRREQVDAVVIVKDYPATWQERFKEILAKIECPGVLAALALGAVLYVIFAATTPIMPGGHGWDGKFYEGMTRVFSLSRLGHLPAISGPYNTRYLPSVIAHYIHPNPVVAFKRLNIIAIIGIILACYGIFRFYALPVNWTVPAIGLYLISSPALRWWIYYPILTDQLGTALFLATIWTILTRRYLLYSVFAAALLTTRENGIVIFVFFALFHLNPWNSYRDKEGHPLGRMLRLTAWNLFPLLVFLQVRFFPLFPQDGNFDSLQYAKSAMERTLASPGKQYHMLLAVLNGFGVLPYVLIWGIFSFGLRRVVNVLRENLHWIWYVIVNMIFAALSWTDHERFLTAAVPVLVLACAQMLRELPTGSKLTSAIIIVLAILHGYLTHTFGPIGDVVQWWGPKMSPQHAAGLVRMHLLMASILGAILVLKLIFDRGFPKSVGRILRRT